MFKYKFYIVLLLFISTNVFTQKIDKSLEFYYDYAKKFNVDYFYYPAENKDSINLLIFYKFNNSFFSYEKETINESTVFTSVSNITIDVKDDNGIIRKSLSINEKIICNSFEDTKSKFSFFRNCQKLTLKKGSYSINIDLNTKKFERIKNIKINNINLNFNNYSNNIKPLMIYENYEGKPIPFIHDSAISFNYDYSYIIFLSEENSSQLNYNIKLKEKQSGYSWISKYDKKGLVSNTSYQKADEQINSISNIIQNELNYDYLKKFNLKLNKIRIDKNINPGNYLVEITGNEIKSTHNFEVIWEEMPLALKNPEYAAELMYYILPDDVFKKISSGSKQEIFTKILEYWKSQDPTPNTEFNEKMISYFKRVDYAFFNYQTISEKDGAKTERGKIYILYGAPDKIDRRLNDKSNQETWFYTKLKKEFIFLTNPNGSYILSVVK